MFDMAWIKTKSYKESEGKLRKLYDRIKGPNDNVDNIMLVHSLRPNTLEGHMVLYKNVLHHASNTNPKWFLELIGVWVSILNNCDYCILHHFEGLKRLLNNDAHAENLKSFLLNKDLRNIPLAEKHIFALEYSQKLTEEPRVLEKSYIEGLRVKGFSDGEILEINQVVSYFNYANRTVLGLGCNTRGDILGLSPGNSSDPNDWSHK